MHRELSIHTVMKVKRHVNKQSSTKNSLLTARLKKKLHCHFVTRSHFGCVYIDQFIF
jgi:hypothetical protein